MNRLERLFGGWRFPVVALSLLGFATLLSGAMLVVPPGDTSFHAFAQEFRAWCFGYDPSTGKAETAYVLMILSDPLLLGVVVVGVWWRPLKAVTLRLAMPLVATTGLVVVGGAVAFAATWTPPQQGDALPFPAERLRTAIEPPQFTLTDQDGRRVSLADFSGEVVMLTGVYSTCGHACPLILQQAKRAVDALPPVARSRVTVLALTLDPANDTPQRMKVMAENYGMTPPQWRMLTGTPADVEPVLDRLGLERRRNDETGVIDHANLFLLVDPAGKIAYRLTLGDRQEHWLTTALEHLARESAGPRG